MRLKCFVDLLNVVHCPAFIFLGTGKQHTDYLTNYHWIY